MKLTLCIASFSVSLGLGLILSDQALAIPTASASQISGEEGLIEFFMPFWVEPLSPRCFLPPVTLSGLKSPEVMGLTLTEELLSDPEQVDWYLEMVYSLFAQMQEHHSGGSSRQRVLAKNPRIIQLINEGRFEMALRLAQQIQDEFDRNGHLMLIVEAYLDRDQVERAEALALSIPAPSSEEIDRPPTQREWAIREVIDHYKYAGQLESALALVDELDEWFGLFCLLDIAEWHRRYRQFDAALPILDRAIATYKNQMGREFWSMASAESPNLARLLPAAQFYTLGMFADRYRAIEASEKAAALAPEMFALAQNLQSQNFASLSELVHVADLYRISDQRAAANAVLMFVIEKIEDIEQPYLKAIVFAKAVRLYAALGETDRAEELLFQAQGFADAAENADQRNASTMALVPAYLVLGQSANAAQITEAIEPPFLREQVQEVVICGRANLQR